MKPHIAIIGLGVSDFARAKRFYALRPRAVAALRESRRALLQMWRGVDELLERT